MESKKEILVKKKQDWENKMQGKRREQGAYWKNYYRSPEWIEKITNAPYTNLAKDLLRILEEDLIERLIISSYRKGRGKGQGVTRKQLIFGKTFVHFPNCELELTEVGKDDKGKYVPYRWQRMNEIMPDWDIFVDDNPNIVNETIKNVPDKNKIYVLPDYKNCRGIQGPNVYHVKTTLSDLTDKEIVQVAQEYQTKKASKTKPSNQTQISETQFAEKLKNYWPLIIGSLVGGCLVIIVLVVYLWNKRK